MKLSISSSAQLRLLVGTDAEELHSLIEKNRAHLAPWFSWAANQAFEDTLEFLRHGEGQVAASEAAHCAIVCGDRIVGVISYMKVNWRHRRTVLGYWLDADHQGGGLMTAAVSSMVEHAFSAWELNRVEIRAAVENRKSRAIAERLGFEQEGLLRQADLVDGRGLDTVVYAMLAAVWNEGRSAREV